MEEAKAVEADSPRDVLRASMLRLVEEMKARQVQSDEDYKFLEEWRRKAKDTERIIDQAFEAERVEKKAAYDAVLDEKRTFKVPLLMALDAANGVMSAYATEKERVRREAVAKLEAENRKKKEDDALVKAQNLSSMGRQDEAERVLEKPIQVSRAAVVAAAPPKVGKVQERWEARVTDKAAFLAEAARIPALAGCVGVNLVALARFFKENPAAKVPGAEGVQKFVPVL
jgi:hypothetical protein